MSRLTPERIAAQQKHLANALATATPKQRRQAALDAWQFTSSPDGWYLIHDVHSDELDYVEESLAALTDRDGFDSIIGITRHTSGHTHAIRYTVHLTFRRVAYTAEDLATALRTLEKLDLVRVSLPSQGFIIEAGTIQD